MFLSIFCQVPVKRRARISITDEPSIIEAVNNSGVSNNQSNESLEMPPLPTMDSDEGEQH